MNKFAATLPLIAAVAAVSAAGCASDGGRAYQQQKAAQAANQPKDALTGSRLVKPTTERVVRAIGNNEYNEQGNIHTSIGNSVGAKSN